MSCLKLDVIQQWEMKKEKNPARLPVCRCTTSHGLVKTSDQVVKTIELNPHVTCASVVCGRTKYKKIIIITAVV